MEVQVGKEHYDFDKYVDAGRWSSYYCQIHEAFKAGTGKCLVIGPGDGLVPQIYSLSES